jgi:predicted peptidase
MRATALITAILLLVVPLAAQDKKKQPPTPIDPQIVQRFEQAKITHGGVTIGYRLLKPRKIAVEAKLPLVLFLHGSGERGDDNQAQLKFLPTWMSEPAMLEKFPCILVAPQCPSGSGWSGPTLAAAAAIVDEAVKQWPVDRNRIYLTGLSMGGYGSWELAAQRPELFAAVAPICGGGDPGRASTLAKLPIWVWHGDADKAVKVEKSREMVEAIKKAGGDIHYTEIKGGSHADAWNQAYQKPDGVVPWLFKHTRGR